MIILASSSPRRIELMQKIGIDFKVVPPDFSEDNTQELSALEYAVSCAKGKAEEVHSRTGGTVIAADTIVVADGTVLGKPKDAKEAKAMLKMVCGKEHEVITGVCLIKDGKTTRAFEKTKVFIDTLDTKEINSYIKSGLPMDRAGAYGLQDEIIQKKLRYIKGSEDNVIGLPTELLTKLLVKKPFGKRK